MPQPNSGVQSSSTAHAAPPPTIDPTLTPTSAPSRLGLIPASSVTPSAVGEQIPSLLTTAAASTALAPLDPSLEPPTREWIGTAIPGHGGPNSGEPLGPWSPAYDHWTGNYDQEELEGLRSIQEDSLLQQSGDLPRLPTVCLI